MKKTAWMGIGLLMLACAGLVLAQTGPETPFGPRVIIGSSPPDDFIVDPIGDRLIFVQGERVNVLNADFEQILTFQVDGPINTSTVSHDARMIALGVGRQVQLYSLETGDLLTSIEPPATNYVAAPMMFSDDDSFLSFIANAPASQATRRSENDTDNLPWLWDVNAALDLGDSRLPGRVDAYSFFDLRQGGLFMLPNNLLLGALISNYQLFDIDDSITRPAASLDSDRFENDPIPLWLSAAGEMAYLRDNGGRIGFINTRTRGTWQLSIGASYSYNAYIGEPSALARIVGEARSRTLNPLAQAIFGYDYRADYNYHPLTFGIRDLLEPVTEAAGRDYLLITLADDTRGTTTLELLAPANGEQMAIDPGYTRLALRSISDGAVTIYDLDSGAPILRFTPALPPVQTTDEIAFEFTADGEAMIIGYARYDSRTGAPLIERRDTVTGFDAIYFRDDGQTMVTFSDTTWRVWDVATQALLRTETLYFGSDSVQAISRNGERALLGTNQNGRQGRIVYDIAANTRDTVLFDMPRDMALVDIVPSAGWSNFLVRYAPVRNDGQHGSNGGLAIYNLHTGLTTFMAGTDLPMGAGEYGWIDETTAFIVGDSDFVTAPDRVIGVDFAPSGVPACLIDRFPERRAAWEPIWRLLSYRQASDDLARLAQRACAAADAEAVAALYTPTPVFTPQPQAVEVRVSISGVPDCLTSAFSEQAIAYARDWRTITDGLTDEQIAEMAEILCEGLSREFAGGFTPRLGEVDSQVIYAIDAASGRRTQISAVPRRVSDESSVIAFLQDLYTDIYPQRSGLFDLVLSPNREWIAQSSGTRIEIYPITTPVAVLVQNATATAAATLGAQPNTIRLMPTATPQPVVIGLPGPTLTPTIIPTFIVPPDDYVGLRVDDPIEPLCPLANAVPYAQRSASFQPTGRLIGRVYGVDTPAVLDFSTGQVTLDTSLPPCGNGVNCMLSLDQRWILRTDGAVRVMRPDGAEEQIILSAEEADSVLRDVRWHDVNRVRLTIERYVPTESQSPRPFHYYYDVRDRVLSEPQSIPDEVRIDGLPTTVYAIQPNGGTLVIAWTPVPLPNSEGARWYVVDRATGEARYFAGTPSVSDFQGAWQRDGAWFDYWIAGNTVPGYRLDGATGQIARLESLPGGERSRDGLFAYGRFMPEWDADPLEREARIARGELVLNITLEDLRTGTRRAYCVPRSDAHYEQAWSLDGRYLALGAEAPGDQSEQVRRYQTVYILDTVTGEVVDMQADMVSFFTWIETDAGGGT